MGSTDKNFGRCVGSFVRTLIETETAISSVAAWRRKFRDAPLRFAENDFRASVVMHRLSHPTETVSSNKSTRY